MRADVMRAEDEDTDDTEAADDEEEEVDTRYKKEDVILYGDFRKCAPNGRRIYGFLPGSSSRLSRGWRSSRLPFKSYRVSGVIDFETLPLLEVSEFISGTWDWKPTHDRIFNFMSNVPITDIEELPRSKLVDAADWLRESSKESQLSMLDWTRERARLEALLIQKEVILDAHIEIFSMMKEDPWYEEVDVRRHGLDGLEREKMFTKLVNYVPDYDLVMNLLKRH